VANRRPVVAELNARTSLGIVVARLGMVIRPFRNGRSGLGHAYRICPCHALFQTLFKLLLFWIGRMLSLAPRRNVGIRATPFCRRVNLFGTLFNRELLFSIV